MIEITDFHSHILPGIDDGSKTVAESLEMLRMEWSQGIRHVVATPHFYPQHDRPERFLERRARAEDALREEMAKFPDLPTISVGAEVYYFHGISDSTVVSKLTIGESRYLLLEMPQAPWTDAMYRELEGLYTKRGIIPVIAHVDRYIGRFRDHGIPARLAELPVLIQANGDFFLKRSTSGLALRMLKKNGIHLLGSDCHNTSSRKPNLGEVTELIRKRLGEETVAAIRSHEKRILQDRF